MGQPQLTVAICTYNRASRLERMLQSAIEMTVPEGLDWEILVINNNSNDQTEAVAEEFARRLPLRCVTESKQGLSHARNRALAEFNGNKLLFTDDDVRLSPAWLANMVAAWDAMPGADFIGGRVTPDWVEGRPAWVRDENMPLLGGLLVSYQLGDEDRPLLTDDPLPFGASFGFTRKLADRVGTFRPDLGVRGSDLGRGEESDYLERAVAQGFTGVYAGRAVCYHEVDYRRLELPYLYRYGRDKGASEVRRNGANTRPSPIEIATYLFRGAYQAIRGNGDRARMCVINMGLVAGRRAELARKPAVRRNASN